MLKMKIKILILILFLGATPLKLIAQENSTPKGEISGKVISEMTQTPISGVIVTLIGTKKGAVTDPNGRFRIKGINPGIYALDFRHIGYKSYVQTDVVVTTGKPYNLDVELATQVIKMEGATVKAKYFIKKSETVTSTQVLNSESIRRAPGVQEDVVRAAALLPGVGVTQAGRNDLVVRGGAPFENLYIVDGIEVPNINHFGSQGASGGPLSLINLDFVKSVSFSAGGFGSKYGDKTSSIMNIKLRNGNEDQFGGTLNLSATGFGLNLEGPIADKGSYLLSARRSYLDFIFEAAGFGFIPQYWDFHAKFNYNIDKSNNISFLTIGALNDVKLNNENIDNRYDNSQVAIPNQKQYFSGITWKHLFDNGFSTITLAQTMVDFNTFQNDSNLVEIFRNNSLEAETSLKSEVDLQLADNLAFLIGNTFKFASSLDYDILIPGEFRKDQSGIPQELAVDTSMSLFKNSTYSSITMGMGQNKITAGLRLDYYDFLNDNVYLSPRLSFVRGLNPVSSIIFSAGRYYQAPSYIWLIGGKDQDLKAIKADQIVIGYDHTPLEDVKVQLEIFYKWYGNYPARVYRPQSVLQPSGFDNLQSDIPFGLEPLESIGEGQSRGIELFIQKKLSEIPLYGLLSITLSETKFTSIDGIERFGAFDGRFIMNFALGYRFNQEWEASTKFRYATGLPTTPFNSDGSIDYTRYNEGERLPDFHALDIRIDKRWTLGAYYLITYIDIQNIYNRGNISAIRWNFREMKPEMSSSIGILPSIGIKFEF